MKRIKRNLLPVLRSKKIVVFSVITLVIVAASLLLLIMQARQQYYQHATQWKQQLQSSLQTTTAQLKEQLENPADTQQIIQTLNTLHQTFKNHTAPTTPAIFGIATITNNESTTRKQADEARGTLSAALEQTKQLLEYQLSINTALAPLSGKSSTNLEELQQLSATWEQASGTIKATAPPQNATDAHQQLMTLLDQLQTDLSALIPLYEKQEIDAFNKQGQAFLDKVSQLKQLGGIFEGLFKTQDAQLRAAHESLKQALEIL